MVIFSYLKPGREHAGCHDQVRDHIARHAERQQNRFAGVYEGENQISDWKYCLGNLVWPTRVQRRIDDFFRAPQLRRHAGDLILLVGSDEALRVVQASGRDEQRPVYRNSQQCALVLVVSSLLA